VSGIGTGFVTKTDISWAKMHAGGNQKQRSQVVELTTGYKDKQKRAGYLPILPFIDAMLVILTA